MKRRYFVLAATLFLSDVILTAAAFYVAYLLRLRTEYPPPVQVLPFATYAPMMALQVIGMVTAYAFMRLYTVRPGSSRIDEIYGVFVGTALGTVLSLALTSFVLKNLDYPRLMIPYAWVLTLFLVGLSRLLIRRLVAALHGRGVDAMAVVIVGAGSVGRRMMGNIVSSPQLGYRLVGFIDNDASISEVNGAPVLGTTEDLPRVLREHKIEDVLVALPHAAHQEILEIASLCESAKVNVRFFPDVFQLMASEVSINDLNGMPLVTVRDVALRGWRLTLKRAVDVVLSAMTLVALSPVLLLTAILVKLDSAGPAFYVQERVGLDGITFQCLKFRTMCLNAEAETGPVWAKPDDPRRTRLGGILRRLSIDEFPQFINVLLGDMSIVGPRPERPSFVEQFSREIPHYMDRHREKAGITGWAQVNGLRGDTSIDERTRYDLWYVENWSLWLDLKIMLRTAIGLFRDKNAY